MKSKNDEQWEEEEEGIKLVNRILLRCLKVEEVAANFGFEFEMFSACHKTFNLTTKKN